MTSEELTALNEDIARARGMPWGPDTTYNYTHDPWTIVLLDELLDKLGGFSIGKTGDERWLEIGPALHFRHHLFGTAVALAWRAIFAKGNSDG